jgi:hypothetical protein
MCTDITGNMVEVKILERSKISTYIANKELRYLRATFNYGLGKNLISSSPTKGIGFLPVEKRLNPDGAKVEDAPDPMRPKAKP